MKMLICLVGDSGEGKSSAIATFIRGLHHATGKMARVYNCDGGSSSLDYVIDAGMAERWHVSRATYPFELLVDITQGYWPQDTADPISPREPTFFTRYVGKCEKCGKELYGSEKAYAGPPLVCPADKVPVIIRMTRVANPKNDLSRLGAVVYEGLTGFGESLMDRMSDLSAQGQKIGEDVAVRFDDGREKVGAVSRSSYGMAQRRMKRAVEDSSLLPVDYVIWTALKDRGEDRMDRTPVYGPKLPGHAAVDDVPRWFGPTLFMATVPNMPTKGATEYRIYLDPFVEDWGNAATKDIKHKANSRIPPIAKDGMKPYYVFKADDPQFLWDIIKLIAERQARASELALAKPKPSPQPK